MWGGGSVCVGVGACVCVSRAPVCVSRAPVCLCVCVCSSDVFVICECVRTCSCQCVCAYDGERVKIMPTIAAIKCQWT